MWVQFCYPDSESELLPMSLPPDQARELHDALLDAFRDIEALQQMVFFRVGRNLLELANTANLANAMFDLINNLESYGELDQLLAGAIAERPNNPQLAAIVNTIRRKSTSTPAHAPSPIRHPQPPSGNPFEGRSTSLLGRDRELGRVLEKLRTGNHCSVVGPEGSGKTLLLDHIITALPDRLGWSAGDWIKINIQTVTNLSDLQRAIVLHLGGQRVSDLRSRWAARPPRLLIFDDVGGMPTGDLGLKIRVWLRGLTDTTHFLVTSNHPLHSLFGNDPNTTSPFVRVFGSAVEMPTLAPDQCRRLVESRLAPFGLPSDPYADLYSAAQQPKALLRRCAERYEALTEGHA